MRFVKTLSLFFLLAGLAINSHAQFSSSFTANADGWTFLDSDTPVTVDHHPGNGNHGGYISATYPSNITAAAEGWFAPAEFLDRRWQDHSDRICDSIVRWNSRVVQADVRFVKRG
jgi:hypothetical protein